MRAAFSSAYFLKDRAAALRTLSAPAGLRPCEEDKGVKALSLCAGESAEAVSAAAAQDQKDPDDIASASESAAVVMFTASAAEAASAAAAQDQDQPDDIKAAS